MPQIEVAPASPGRWADVVAVMGTKGDASWCWCQYFRVGGQAWRESTASLNRERLREQVEVLDAPPPGVLAYLDQQPVGWCAVGPKSCYARLQRSPLAVGTATDRDEQTWSVTCFQVKPNARRRGVASHLLDGALALARENGAMVVEAYAVDASRRPRASSSELFHGPLSLFLRAGFEEVARPYPARVVVRRSLL